ncbi:MAG: hypothetical protein JSW38_07680 [Dehalococcoidia bacterium]|nr:MAG: hypothetical protein JSW38_07680 [Dehalococcoidia bacterium]
MLGRTRALTDCEYVYISFIIVDLGDYSIWYVPDLVEDVDPGFQGILTLCPFAQLFIEDVGLQSGLPPSILG